MLPLAKTSDQLRDTDCASWAALQSELKDVRDQKEMQYLAKLFWDLSQGRTVQIADALAMRMRELRYAKSSGGSWDKAAVLTLRGNTALPSNAPIPDGAMAL